MSWDTITVIEHEKSYRSYLQCRQIKRLQKEKLKQNKPGRDWNRYDFCVTGAPGERFSGWTSPLWSLTSLSFCAPHSHHILYHYKLWRQFVFHFEFPFSHGLHVYNTRLLWGEIRCWSRQVTKASAAAPKGSCRSHVKLCSFVRFLLLLFFMLCYCKEKLDVRHVGLRKVRSSCSRLKCVRSFVRSFFRSVVVVVAFFLLCCVLPVFLT